MLLCLQHTFKNIVSPESVAAPEVFTERLSLDRNFARPRSMVAGVATPNDSLAMTPRRNNHNGNMIDLFETDRVYQSICIAINYIYVKNIVHFDMIWYPPRPICGVSGLL